MNSRASGWQDGRDAQTPAPFWQRLNTFFAFPLQMGPLAYAALLSLSSLLVLPLAGIFGPLAVLVVVLGLLLAISRYGFKVMALGARGVLRTADYPFRLEEDFGALPWKLFFVLLVQTLLAAVVRYFSAPLGIVAALLVSLVLPATMIVLVLTGSAFAALSPARLWDTVAVIGWPYLALCFFFGLLNGGMELGVGLALTKLGPWVALPLLVFVVVYFSWVMCVMLGYVVYQHHEEFGIEPLPAHEGGALAADARAGLTPEQAAQRAADRAIAQHVADGDIEAAVNLAYEAQRTAPESLSAQRRYHRVLLLSDKTSTLLEQGQRFVEQLVRADQNAEALRVYQSCRERDAGFAPQAAGATYALARHAWQAGDARGALALVNGFDKRFRGDALIPQVYELAARVLVQGLGRPEMAGNILNMLQQKYPDSEATREVQWLLRGSAADADAAPKRP